MIVKIGKYIINTDLITHIYKDELGEYNPRGSFETIYVCFGECYLCFDKTRKEHYNKAMQLYIWFLERAIDDIPYPSQ